ncbi:hypothetical protein [Halomicrobium katesii]|nr:hypothetical protein [Halomicrobium katesii]
MSDRSYSTPLTETFERYSHIEAGEPGDVATEALDEMEGTVTGRPE